MERKIIIAILIIGSFFIYFSCGTSTPDKKDYEIVYQRKFGKSKLYMCFVTDSTDKRLIKIGQELTRSEKLGFVIFYTDKSKVKNILISTDLIDALPEDGFYAKYRSSDGYTRNFKH